MQENTSNRVDMTNKHFRSAELIFFFFAAIKKSTRLQTKRGGQEGKDRTQFLWRKPSQTEAHLPVAPPLGTSMSWLSGPAPCHKVSSQNQGLSVVRYPPGTMSGGSH